MKDYQIFIVPVGQEAGDYHLPDSGIYCPEDSRIPIVYNPGVESRCYTP